MIAALFPCFLAYLIIRELVFGWVAYFFTLLMVVLGTYVVYILWPLCFGELTLTEGYVKWHALFMRSVKIPYSELRYVEIRHFDEGNVVPDLYGTGQMYLLLSSKSLPKKRIDKIRSGDGLIKYQFLMRDAEVFSEYLPERYKPMFQSRAETYTRAKEKRARDWQKWKAKRKKAREKRRKKRQAEKQEKHESQRAVLMHRPRFIRPGRVCGGLLFRARAGIISPVKFQIWLEGTIHGCTAFGYETVCERGVCVGFRGLQAHARRVPFFCLWAENRRQA